MNKLIQYLLNHVVVRFIISGGTSAVVDLLALYILNSVLGLHYLTSAILAFLTAFCVSFTLHKYWTFKSHSEETHKQMALYLLSSLTSLALNTLLMYIFVDRLGIMVMLSQVIVGIIVAFFSFFMSRKFVFKYTQKLNNNLE